MYIKGLNIAPGEDIGYMTIHHENLVFDCVFDYHLSTEDYVKDKPFIEGINFDLYSTRNGIHRIDCDFDLAIENPHDIFRCVEEIAQDIIVNWYKK